MLLFLKSLKSDDLGHFCLFRRFCCLFRRFSWGVIARGIEEYASLKVQAFVWFGALISCSHVSENRMSAVEERR